MTKDTKNNTGEENTGNYNSGNYNSGDYNSGNYNSGDYNSGNRNSGYYNSGNCNSGMFNTNEPNVRMFNKSTNLKWKDIDLPHSNEFYLTKWIPEEDMTDKEKKADPEFCVRKGYLREYSYKEAWKNFWRDTDEENRKKFLNLPNFNWEIFTEITGITPEDKEDLVEIKVEGKTKKISRRSAKELNLI